MEDPREAKAPKDETDLNVADSNKENSIPEGLEQLLQKLPDHGTTNEAKSRLENTAKYVKEIYLKLIDAAYTSNKGDKEIERLMDGLVGGDPKVVSELCNLRYISVMAKHRKSKTPPPEATQLLNARATFANVGAKAETRTIPTAFRQAFPDTQPKYPPSKRS